FEFPCHDRIKEKLMQSVLFAERQLKELLQTTMDSFCFTTDLWSQIHQPYIAVTIHWISPDFTLHQALLTIQKFDYPHTGASTDNASSMIKAMDQLGIEHIGCTVHTIQLALGDGFDKEEVSNLINKAKTLNSYVNGKDKYREKLRQLQAELNPQHQVNPLSSDTRTRWSSTYNLLKNLFLLRNAIVRLANDLKQNVNRQERQDGTKLSELLLSIEEWNSIDELAKLLCPFAQVTGYIGGSQYPTLGMMIPTLIKLSRHLRDFYPKATSQVVKACCSKINQSMLSRWFEPSYHSLIAAFLDPRFKKMNYITPIKKRETIAHLYTLFDTQERPSSIQEPQTSNTGPSSFFASFYDDDYVAPNETENISSVEKEVTLYDNLPEIPKYHITDEEY
ncbi:4325_t:CDS:2, partial [Cetraspora pellucida]